jgi:hypothetical protein
VITLTLLAIGLACPGAGTWSLDHALAWFQLPGWWGLGIVLMAGAGGAAGLLVCYRRSATEA